MAKTLQDFLNERARSDLRDLALLQPHVTAALKCNQYMPYAAAYATSQTPHLAKQAEQLMAHAPDLFKITSFNATRSTVDDASLTGLRLAGEAVKQIERTRPELLQQYPDFPWTALKRMRDYYSHPARFEHAPERQAKADKAILKEVDKLYDYFGTYNVLLPAPAVPQPPIDDAVTRALAAGMRLFIGLQKLNRESSHDAEGNMMLTGTQAAKNAADFIGCGEAVLPTLVIENAKNHYIQCIGDTITRISCFSRRHPDSPLSNKHMSKFMAMRDKTAHFGTSMEYDAWNKNAKQLNIENQVLQQIDADLTRLPAPEGFDKCATDMANGYMKEQLGKACDDPNKQALADRCVQDITQRGMNANLENAYVRAACMLIQKMPLNKAAPILDYAIAHADLKTPEDVKRNQQDCPHVLRRDVRDFVDTVIDGASPPGTNRTHRGGVS